MLKTSLKQGAWLTSQNQIYFYPKGLLSTKELQLQNCRLLTWPTRVKEKVILKTLWSLWLPWFPAP